MSILNSAVFSKCPSPQNESPKNQKLQSLATLRGQECTEAMPVFPMVALFHSQQPTVNCGSLLRVLMLDRSLGLDYWSQDRIDVAFELLFAKGFTF